MAIVKHKGSDFWYMSFQLNGKKIFRSTKTTNKVTARQIEAKTREQLVKEQTLGRELEQITLIEAFDLYLKSKEGTPYHKVLTSVRNPVFFGHKRCNKTKQRVNVYKLDKDLQLHHLRTSDLNRLVEARKKEGSADATIKQHVMAVAGAWKHAKDLGYMVDEAISFPSFKRERRDPVFLTPEEEQKLLEALDPTRDVPGYGKFENRTEERQRRLQDQYDFVVCLLDTGGRYHEITHLEWKNVDLAGSVMFVKQWKTNKSHTIHMTERVKAVLMRRAESKRAKQVYVFENDEQTSHRPYHNLWFQRAVERAGITKKIRFHKLRSTFASKLVQQGVSLFEVQQLLGHTDPSTTMVYASLIPSDVSRKAATILNSLTA